MEQNKIRPPPEQIILHEKVQTCNLISFVSLKMIRCLKLLKLFFTFIFLIFLSTLLLRTILESLNEFIPKVPAEVLQESADESFLNLENFITSRNQPSKDCKNIFFLDTIRMKKRNKTRIFTSRQACAVESAGR